MHKPIELAQNLASRYPPLYRLSRNEGEGLLVSRQCILSSMAGVKVVEFLVVHSSRCHAGYDPVRGSLCSEVLRKVDSSISKR